MSRKTTTLFWLCLLCLFPLLSTAQSLSRFDYWIDDNIGDMQTKSLSGTSAEIIEELDLSALPMGVHKVCFRVVQTDGYQSAVNHLLFFKGIMGNGGTLEYWFDDQYDQRLSTPFDAGNGEMQELTLDLRNNTTFPMGFHKLNLRVIINGKASAVYTSHVLKLQAGSPNQLEYWIDGKYETVKTIEGQLSADGSVYVFTNDLDLSDVAPGYHRLFCRAVSSSRRTVTAVVSTPVIVKSKYNMDHPENLTVTDQAYWFDNEEPVVLSVAYPNNVITQPDKIDARRLSDGQHTLHVQFGNSAGLWSGVLDHKFTKSKIDDPVINASVSETEGVATFKFNSLANALQYNLIRVYPSGSKRKVQHLETTQHPLSLQLTDTPPVGTYTYYVEGVYADVDNMPQKVYSNNISVTVDKVASTLKSGAINGVITHDGKEIINPSFHEYKVLINGEDAYKTNYYFCKEQQGHFVIGDIPYGTDVNIQIEEDNHSYQNVRLIVNENTRHQKYLFNGTSTETDDLQPEHESYDLRLERSVTVTPTAWEMTVYNKSKNTWKGNLMVVIVNKEHKDIDDKMESGEGTTLWETAFTPKNYFESRPVYVTSANQRVELEGRKTTVLSLDIIDLPQKNKEEEYYVYVYSQREGTDEKKELLYSGTKPMVVDFNPKNCVTTDLENFAAYMKGYAKVLKLLKKFAAWGDPFKLAFGPKGATQTALDNIIDSYENDLDLKDLNKDVVDAAIKSTGLLLNCFFSDMDKAVKLAEKSIKGFQVAQLHHNIYELYSKIEETYNAVNADDNHKFFELAKLVLKYVKLNNGWNSDPVISVYKTYFEVGEAMADAAERFANTISHQYLWNRLAEGNAIYNIKVRRSSPSGGHGGYFHGRDYFLEKGAKTKHDGMIETIEIQLKSPTGNGEYTKVVGNENIELTDEGITIKNVKFGRGIADGRNEIEAWMVITWKNKRVTHVPLVNNDFMKIENLDKMADNNATPAIFTVELQSTSNQNPETIPNKLNFVKP